MPVCRSCKAHVPLFEVADEESYDGGNLATCRDCASAAAAAIAKQHGRVHWRDRSEAVHHDRNVLPRATALPEGTSEDLWTFCQRCADYLRVKGYAVFHDGRGAVKWMTPAEGSPDDLCHACGKRPGDSLAFVRFARAADEA